MIQILNKNKKYLLFMILFLLTGCVKYDIGMSVNTDKSFDLNTIIAVKKEYAESEQSTFDISNYEKKGYIVDKYSDNTYSGYTLKASFDNIDDVSIDEDIEVELGTLFDNDVKNIKLYKKVRKNNSTIYYANFKYDLSAGENDLKELDELKEQLELKYEVDLPSPAITSNAVIKSDDNKKLTWNIEYGKVNEINYSFEINDKDITEKINKEETKKETNTKKEDVVENKEVKLSPLDKIKAYLSLALIIAIIVLVVYFKKKINIINKKVTGFHQELPDTLKKKK